uniref:Transcription factor 25 n=1 Tax=Bracon brevicornis TaxID=1563983 RepID=A0A6V7I2D9_9HYME
MNEDTDSDPKEGDEEEEEENLSEEQPSATAKSKKKKKKKRKKEKKVDETAKDDSQDDSIDEIERSLREVNKLLGEPVQPGSSRTQERPPQTLREKIMSIEPKFLNPQNELKRICGSKVIPGEKSRNRGRTTYLRKTWLTAISDWYPVGKTGLSMTLDESTPPQPGVQYFVFVHSPEYRSAQERFHSVVENMNPELLVSMINAHPYHVDSLMQFADVCRFNEDLQLAAELVERAVHSLECAFHPSFHIAAGNCRLNYKMQTNRALFLALFKHLTFIGSRACYRTSLELSKVLLSLDPIDDPMAIVLSIDLYALRAREYDWFINFCETWNDERNLTQLPNIAYGLALAHFRLDHKEKAAELLQDALFMFPGVLLKLLDKCGVNTDTRVIGHDYFGVKAKDSTSKALRLLESLYIARSFHLWKEADVLPFLETNVTAVMDRIDAGDEYAKFCEMKRSKRYQGRPPRNILRHLALSDFKEISFSETHRPGDGPYYAHDPYPPLDSIDIYPKPGTQAPMGVLSADTNASNLFTLFVSSLFGDVAQALPNRAEGDRENEEQPPPTGEVD